MILKSILMANLAHMENLEKFKSGPIALQYAVPSGGVIKWRKVEIKPL